MARVSAHWVGGGFLLVHGVQVTVMGKLRAEVDPERSLASIQVLPDLVLLRVLGGLVIASGLALVYTQSLWGQGWIWLSLILLASLWLFMRQWGGEYYGLVENAATGLISARTTPDEAAARMVFGTARRAWHPIGMMAGGLGVLAVILWLMIFEPF